MCTLAPTHLLEGSLFRLQSTFKILLVRQLAPVKQIKRRLIDRSKFNIEKFHRVRWKRWTHTIASFEFGHLLRRMTQCVWVKSAFYKYETTIRFVLFHCHVVVLYLRKTPFLIFTLFLLFILFLLHPFRQVTLFRLSNI